MQQRLTFLLLLLFPLLGHAHPGIGIVRDSKGYVYYTDLKQVWQVSPDGKNKKVVVAGVHTHELAIDKDDNLFGEHLWYEGEATDKWRHYVWKRSADGNVCKVIQPTEGFLKNYSFVRDGQGNMYEVERGETCQFWRNYPNGQREKIYSGKFRDIRWQYASLNGTLFFVDDNDLYKITSDHKLLLVAKDLDDEKGQHSHWLDGGHNHNIYGIWEDKKANMYVAVWDKQQVRKIAPDGSMKVVWELSLNKHPVGGLFDQQGNLWLLEYAMPMNATQVKKISAKELAEFQAFVPQSDYSPAHFFTNVLLFGLIGVTFWLVRKRRIVNVICLSLMVAVPFANFAETFGLGVGSKCPAFDPTHVTGLDAGTNTCPMCKYGARTEGLLVWLNDEVEKSEKLLRFLENEYLTTGKADRKVFVMYMNPHRKTEADLKKSLCVMAEKLKLKNIALTFVPSPTDAETSRLYCLNPQNKNTIFAYRKRVVMSRIENFEASDENLKKLVAF
ncbi:MAG: hypothetical protein U0Y10_04225 [Spirosomataceae bacterium]